mmetsp:Transcript_10289/g.26397  ORF Transcript_10289/g.26397 Transcript_10289/m.26397 type:complete len:291 (-) Transcript_10289:191-1063(-)
MASRLRKQLPKWCHLRVAEPALSLREQVANAAVLVPAAAHITAEVLNAASRLRLVAQPAAGYEHIDVKACKARGIPVCVGRGVSSQSVAEGIMCAMMAMAKRLPAQMRAFQDRLPGATIGMQMTGKQLGIIGMGDIGRALAAMARAFSMTVEGVSSSSPRAELERLLRTSDFVSINCPLSDATRGLIGRQELAMMKPGAFLVNFARGPIVDRQALEEKLEETGGLSGVALDVHWEEPLWDPSQPLYSDPRVLSLPHCGFSTEEVYDGLVSLVVRNIAASREGGDLVNRVC